MGIGCSPFQLNGNGCEENNLHRRTTRIPEGTRDAISVCNTRRLKKSGRPVKVGVSLVRDREVSGWSLPCPTTHDRARYQTRFNRSPSCTEHFTCLQFMIVPF